MRLFFDPARAVDEDYDYYSSNGDEDAEVVMPMVQAKEKEVALGKDVRETAVPVVSLMAREAAAEQVAELVADAAAEVRGSSFGCGQIRAVESEAAAS